MRCTPATLPPEMRGATWALGNFDGVHLGHRAVLDAARAAAPDAPLGVATFEPHPRAYFGQGDAPFRLTTPETRARRLARLGAGAVCEVPFDAALAGLGPAAFARLVLSDGLGARHVTVGGDFRFGAGRAGDAETLRILGAEFGFGVTVAPMVALPGGPVSSTRIRVALSEGRPEDAAAMLGHLHRIEGEVIHGHKRGRTLGYPTANMSLAGLHLPAFGVYAVAVDVLDGPHADTYGGAASLGVRPQYGGRVPNLETFLLDFSGDLYGATISVGLVRHLRAEATFASEAAFLAQMARDVDEARAILAAR